MNDLRERVARATDPGVWEVYDHADKPSSIIRELRERSLERADRAIAAGVGAVPAWQSIETAPKGEDLLVYHLNDDGDPQMDVAFWGKPYGTCWVRGTPWERVYPTHWMPLPVAPTPPAAAEEG
jgi:hypothetical protein